jgi:hypothetical protein
LRPTNITGDRQALQMRFNSFVECIELLKRIVGFAYGAVSNGPQKGRFICVLCNDIVIDKARNLLRREANQPLKVGIHGNQTAVQLNSTRRNRHVFD